MSLRLLEEAAWDKAIVAKARAELEKVYSDEAIEATLETLRKELRNREGVQQFVDAVGAMVPEDKEFVEGLIDERVEDLVKVARTRLERERDVVMGRLQRVEQAFLRPDIAAAGGIAGVGPEDASEEELEEYRQAMKAHLKRFPKTSFRASPAFRARLIRGLDQA